MGILPAGGQPQQKEVLDAVGAGMHKKPDNEEALSMMKGAQQGISEKTRKISTLRLCLAPLEFWGNQV